MMFAWGFGRVLLGHGYFERVAWSYLLGDVDFGTFSVWGGFPLGCETGMYRENAEVCTYAMCLVNRIDVCYVMPF